MQNSPTKFLSPNEPTIEVLDKTASGRVCLAKISIEPLERGFGYTIGNALRRVLLSSVAGVAIVEVQIKGARHEYDTVEGMETDVLNLLLNLKGVSFILNTGSEAEVILNKKGSCEITAGDLELPQHTEVVNTEHFLARLNSRGKLEMKIKIKRGCGYQSVDQRFASDSSLERVVNTIYMDASYSPVRRVIYQVESSRVEKQTDLDKLVIELETDGTIDPISAIRRASALMKHQLGPFAEMDADDIETVRAYTDQMDERFLKPMTEFNLSVRSTKCLQEAQIDYVGDLVSLTETQLLEKKNFGQKSLTEVKQLLGELELQLGMNPAGWPPTFIEKARLESNETP